MRANDDIELASLPSAGDSGALGNMEIPAIRPAEVPDDTWMDVHTLRLVPPKKADLVQVTFAEMGRGKPMHHPGIWDDE